MFDGIVTTTADTLGADTLTDRTAEAATVATGPAPAADTSRPALDGTWTVAPPESTFGYRVEEVLSGINTTATGRGNEIAGSITLSGTSIREGMFVIQVTSITSDQSNRDNQFRGRVMETERFPTATFTLTEPIELGGVPAPGEQITAEVTGELTLHGVTNAVTFDVTAETDGDTIGVLGDIPILFSDYDIDNPSNNIVTTEDNGLLEFILVFVPSETSTAIVNSEAAEPTESVR